MRKLIFLYSFCMVSIMSHAQTPKITLYDLVKSLVPDTAQKATEKSWTGLKSNTAIKWQTVKPQFNTVSKLYILIGKASVTIGGKSFGSWDLILTGTATGYSEAMISPATTQYNTTYQTTLEYLFGKSPYTQKLIRKCAIGNEVAYEVGIPGKKPVWLDCYIDGGSGGDAIGLDIYFLQKDLKTNLCE